MVNEKFSLNNLGTRVKNVRLDTRIHIIALTTLKQLLNNKRFYIVSVFYALPVLANVLGYALGFQPFKTGKAIAVYNVHLALNSAMNEWWLSIFGQMFIVLLASDLISNEFDKGTILSLKSRSISDFDIFFGKLAGISCIVLLLIFPGALLIYVTQIFVFAGEDNFWWVFWHSLDELLVACLIIFLGILLLLAICLFFSTIFNRTLQATIVALIAIFSVQFISTIFSFGNSVIGKLNITYYLNLFLDPIFYNIKISESADPILWSLLGFVGVIVLILASGFIIMKEKEIH